MKHLRSAAIFLLLLCLSAFAVTGVVVDGSRSPLQNVIVSFQDDGATTTTDEYGQFTLQPQATGNLDAGQVNPMVSVVNGLIHVSLSEITRVSMSTVDLNGRVIHQMGTRLSISGNYDPLGGRTVPAGIYFVRYQAGSVSGVFTLSISESGRIHSSTRVDPVLKKTVEGAEDSLVLERSGYGSKTVAVADYAQDLDTLVLCDHCGTFIDSRDGHEYRLVTIGTQTWMAENLAYLSSVNTASESSTTIALYYVYNYSGTNVDSAKATSSYSTYGVLYNWPAALTACPTGWHLPSTDEWQTLEASVGGSSIAGQMLKSSTGWNYYSGIANEDTYGFSALPGGVLYGSFGNAGSYGNWWESSELDASFAYIRYMSYNYAEVYSSNNNKSSGLSVRCLQNPDTLLSCGSADSCGTFIDSRDGRTYKWVGIGTQTWMAENLAYLPSVNTTSKSSTTTAQYYVYNYSGTNVDSAKATSSYSTYGVLYNWPAALTACPTGWHLPSTDEWQALEDSVGGSSIAGQMLKASIGWNYYSGVVNEDTYGFSALPGGVLYGSFGNAGSYGNWWESSELDASFAYIRYMSYNYAEVYSSNNNKSSGLSVRCVQD